MEKKVIFISGDDSKFENKEDCRKYEVLYSEVSEIENMLVNFGRTLEVFEYVQQDIDIVQEASRKFFKLCMKEIPVWRHEFKEILIGEFEYSIVGRILEDYNIGCLYRFYFRLSCIDKQGREFQQPAFVYKLGKQNFIELGI